jgi:hypothetical protein
VKPGLAAALAALAAAAFPVAALAAAARQDEKPKVPLDDVNPRATTTPLKIELAPFWCATCLKKKSDVPGLLQQPRAPITLVHKSPELLVRQLEIQDDEWRLIETPHFKLFTTLEGSTVKFTDSVFARFDLERLKTITPGISFGPEGVKLDAHERAHMYHVRLERQYAHFSALTNNAQPNLGMLAPYETFLFADYPDHHAFCDRYIGGRQDKGGVQWHVQEKPNFMLFTTAESTVADQVAKGDGALANHVFHNVAHCLIDGYNNYFRETPAWIEEGLGHYYERRENIRWNNFCWAEGKSPTEFVKPDWETTIFSIVRRGKDPPFAAWCEKLQPGEMTGIENGLSWGLVRWLIETEPVRFTRMIEPMDDLKLNMRSADMIQEAFGCSPSVLYQRWRDYVLKEWAGR